jgi:hypothetical protein
MLLSPESLQFSSWKFRISKVKNQAKKQMLLETYAFILGIVFILLGVPAVISPDLQYKIFGEISSL